MAKQSRARVGVARHLVRRLSVISFVLPFVLNTFVLNTNASAQNVSDLVNLFGGIMREAMIQSAQAEWRKLPPGDVACLAQALRQEGASVEALIGRGVTPSDPRLSRLRGNCSREVAQSTPQTAPSSPHSLWDHNGSIVSLEADGRSRKFRYETPRQGLLDAGAHSGTLLFDGRTDGSRYFGTAYVFKGGCGAFPYNVSGPILNASRTVEMEGNAPQIDLNTCRILGYVHDTLTFNYKEQTSTQLPLTDNGTNVLDVKSAFEQCRKSKEPEIKVSACSFVIETSKNKSQVERAHNSRGLAKMALKQYSDAVQDFSRAIEHDKQNEGYVDNRQSAYFALGQFNRALEDANKAVRMAPKAAYVYRSRALVFGALKSYDSAINDMTIAISLENDWIGLLVERGKLLVNAGKLDSAISDFNRALEVTPSLTWANRERGLAYKIMGEPDKARADLLIAARTDPYDREITDALSGLPAGTGTAPTTPPEQIETPTLLEAREFLEDSQAFLANQQFVNRITEVAREAANLRLAIDKFDEPVAIQSKKRLKDLLDPSKGFTEFLQQRQEDRKQEAARRLAVASAETERNVYFIDEYLRKHLADKRTEALLKHKQRLSASLQSDSVAPIAAANRMFQAYIDENALRDEYGTTVEGYGRPTPIPPKPLTDTPTLLEARDYLNDIQAFISGQQSIDRIGEIAREAADLRIALDKYDESAAIQSSRRLGNLLNPIDGFTAFLQQRKDERGRDKARRLAVASADAEKHIYFLNEYLRTHIGDKTTGQLLKQKERLSNSLQSRTIDEVTKANAAFNDYINDAALREQYDKISQDYGKPRVPPAPEPGTLEERLGVTDKSRFALTGPEDDFVLIYNSSPSAPSVGTNILGQFVYQTGTASLCFAQSTPDEAHVWFLERLLRAQGAIDLKREAQPCDVARTSSIDIVAFLRGELRKQPEEYILRLLHLIENDTFRQYQIVTATEIASEIQNRHAFSLRLAQEVENNQRVGYGALSVTDAPIPACILIPADADYVEGLEELLLRERTAISNKLLSDWQFVEMKIEDAYIAVMKQQCGYVAGEASALRNIMQALRREKKLYEFAPIWFETDKVAAISAEIRQKKAEAAAAIKRQEDLDNAQKQKLRAQKEAVEADLRNESGPKAQALRDRIHNLINRLPRDTADNDSRNLKTQQRVFEAERSFPEYLRWLNRQLADQWETMDVQSVVNDFGVVQWNGRPLDGVIVKTTVKLRNRPLGTYETGCFLLGLVDDVEFAMQRDPFVVICDSSASQQSITKWKQRRQFKSKWNWETDTKTANRTSVWPWSR
jgi:tetratricopeptide (TPR) repeat protein